MSIKSFFAVFEKSILFATLYFLLAFLVGWTFGGPDTIDGRNILNFQCPPVAASRFTIGVMIYLTIALMLLFLLWMTPKPNAWITRITQKRGAIIGLIVIVGTVIIVIALFMAAFLVTGCSSFSHDLSRIALFGVLIGGFLQLMSAAVQPNPYSGYQKDLLTKQKEAARKKASELGISPEEAAEQTARNWDENGKIIGWGMEKAIGLVATISAGGIHGGFLFVFGASFFVGLGFGVSGPTMSILYLIPLLLGFADTATLLTFHILVRRARERTRLTLAAAISLPIAVIGMLYKTILIVLGITAIEAAGGPVIPWPQYVEATQTEPFGSGLTVTIILLASVAWPVFSLAGSAGREFQPR